MDPLISGPWPNFSDFEGELVREVLLSNKVNYWTGSRGRAFEEAFSVATNCRHSLALANGTLAIDLALIGLGIGAGDEVIVTPRSFMASASAVHNCGATPIFADVDPISQNLSVETVLPVLTERTRAILCVHLAGWPCDMEGLMALAKDKGIVVVEDCAQAHGAMIDGVSVGSFGDVAAWSFCQDKIMTTGGEGGMVTTNNSELFEKMWAYKDHGKSRKKMEKLSSSRSFRYVHDSFGSNFRLTEMQAALGHYQLGQLKLWTRERNRNATFYNQNLGELDVVRLAIPSDKVCHGYYKYYCFIRLDQLKGQWDRDRIIEEVTSRGGQCFSGSCPELYREGAFVRAYGEHERLKNAMEIGQQSIMLNVHPGIGDDFLAHNLKILSSVLQEAAA